MLKMFSVSNYRAFRDPITIDFTKVRDYKFNDACIQSNLISKAILYGKNAVGKSNLGYALMDIRSMLLPNHSKIMGDSLGYLNAYSEESAAAFTYHFKINNREIRYYYEKRSATEIQFEELHIDNQQLFMFNFASGEGDFTNLLQYEELKHLNLDHWDNETSVTRYIITNAKLQELSILKDFNNFVSGMAFMETRSSGVAFEGPRIADKGLTRTIIEEDLVDDFTTFLNHAGINISLKKDVKPDGEKTLYFDFARPLEFVKNMSSGTRVLTALYAILRKLDEVSFLYIDEFDANLHFELAEYVLNLLIQKRNCQIFLTTHNTDLMSNKIMRPDCYFVLSFNGIVSVADATTRELREGHNLEKLYQSGEFDRTVSE
ncbi:hypothetical protein A7K91_06800 [Paenibacillus oryzae]|uniref:ATPase AAA-type core domain-containing protein n=2 Tax=Paenibacillus oryzae TaxID=1844972 RepID=A0A1A5YE20_9BACL|nr:hypothetical protein A7K91_06800 [Paenibacillus oryzae]